MKRFAAKQLDASGEPLYYLVEYEVEEQEGIFIYSGRAYATKDVNRELTPEDEAFSYRFERPGQGWDAVHKIEVYSSLGQDLANKIRETFFNDLVLSGIMGVEQRNN
jgi:hypothetical protein